MVHITLPLDPSVVLFYTRIALCSGKTMEQVMADALFKLAGELSLEALQSEDFLHQSSPQQENYL